jgi:hypothetical protein
VHGEIRRSTVVERLLTRLFDGRADIDGDTEWSRHPTRRLTPPIWTAQPSPIAAEGINIALIEDVLDTLRVRA